MRPLLTTFVITALALALGCPQKTPPKTESPKPPARVSTGPLPKGAPVTAEGALDTEALKRITHLAALEQFAFNGSDFAWGAELPADPALAKTAPRDATRPVPDVMIQPAEAILAPPEPPKADPGLEKERPGEVRPGRSGDPGKDPRTPPEKGGDTPPEKGGEAQGTRAPINYELEPKAIPTGPHPVLTRRLSYTGDGLTLSGYGAVPKDTVAGEKRAVVLLIHGTVPKEFYTPDNYRREAEYFAARGYVALVPDLRNMGESQSVDEDPELVRHGQLRDAMNLLYVVQRGMIPEADTTMIVVWGHGYGASVALKIAELSPVKGAIFVAPFGGKEAVEYDRWKTYLDPSVAAGMDALYGPPGPETFGWYNAMSGLSFMEKLNQPLAIYCGELDPVAPVEHGRALIQPTVQLGISSQMQSHPYVGHTYHGQYWLDLMQSNHDFMDQRFPSRLK